MDNYRITVKTTADVSAIEAQLAKISNKKINITFNANGEQVRKITQANTAYGETVKLTEKLNVKTGEWNKTVQTGTGLQVGFVSQIKQAMGAASTWAIAMGLLYGTLRKLSEGMQFVYDFDNQMNKIQMVTQGTDEATKALAVTYSNLATQLSSNTMDVAKNAEEWLRQGRSVADTNSLIKTSMVFSKVGFLDSAEAASLLTSSINGYGLAASEAMSVVDKMSAIDVNAATSTKDLALALAQTASSAKLAGVSLDEALSYIAVVSDVTQKSAESIGNSFKTIFARMQQVKLGSLVDQETGDDISNVDKVLKSYGITLRDVTTGQFRDTGDVLDELSVKWKNLNSLQKSEIMTVIAGVRQRENGLVLLENYDKALALQEVSLKSGGSAMEKFATYEDSATAASERLKNSFQKLFMDIDSKFIKGLINFGAGFLTLVDKVGGLRTVISALSIFLLPMFISKISLAVSALKTFIATASIAQLSFSWIGIALTAISVGLGIYASHQAKITQLAQESSDAFSTQTQNLVALGARYTQLLESTSDEATQRAELISLIKDVNAEYEDEAINLQTNTALRALAIKAMREEGVEAAKEFTRGAGSKIEEARGFFERQTITISQMGKADQILVGAQQQIDYYGKMVDKYDKMIKEGKKLDILQNLDYKDMLSKYKNLVALKNELLPYYEKAAEADRIIANLGQYGMAEYTLNQRNQEKLRQAAEEKALADELAQIAAEKAEEENKAKKAAAEAKLNKINEEYLERLIKLKLKAIANEEKATAKLYDDQINALKKINDERQNEIDLMKAKDALLKAQTQKRMVYREGVGFVAEADQSAIQEAQDNLTKIENEAKIAEIEAKKSAAEAAGGAKEAEYRKLLLEQMKAETRPGMQDVYANVLGLIRGADDHWYDGDGNRAFAQGGIVDFTGKAMVHGKPNEPELMINNAQTSALFRFIQGLTSPNMTRNMGLVGASGGQSVNIYGAINLPSVKDGYGFIKELGLISKNR